MKTKKTNAKEKIKGATNTLYRFTKIITSWHCFLGCILYLLLLLDPCNSVYRWILYVWTIVSRMPLNTRALQSMHLLCSPFVYLHFLFDSNNTVFYERENRFVCCHFFSLCFHIFYHSPLISIVFNSWYFSMLLLCVAFKNCWTLNAFPVLFVKLKYASAGTLHLHIWMNTKAGKNGWKWQKWFTKTLSIFLLHSFMYFSFFRWNAL